MSARQPWATLLARGFKDVENRERWTPPAWALESREPVWIGIHAGVTIEAVQVYRTALRRAGMEDYESAIRAARAEWPRGAIVGLARFVGYRRSRAVQRTIYEALSGQPAGDEWAYYSPWYSPGMTGVGFADAFELAEPIPCKGQQVVWWRPGQDVLSKLEAALQGRQREAA